MSEPLLSVCLITYNHQSYIEQAIESVLQQEVNFAWELIIADDCSTDGTREIIRQYAEKHPERIKLILQEKNVGPAQNWMDLITAPKGKYIAYFEGDDYWTDSLKLQKQVDFLEANPEFSGCFHRFEFIYENSNQESRLSNENQKEVLTFDDMILSNPIGTGSFVFHNKAFHIPDWLLSCTYGDIALFLLTANSGKIKFLPETMSAYRVHNRGIWSSASQTKRIHGLMSTFKVCRQHFYPRGNVLFLKKIANYNKKLLYYYFVENNFKGCRQMYIEYVWFARHNIRRGFFSMTVWYLLSHFPGIAVHYKQFKKFE